MFQLCFIISNPVLPILEFQSSFFSKNLLTYGRDKSFLTYGRDKFLLPHLRTREVLTSSQTRQVLTSSFTDAKSPYFLTCGREKSILPNLRTRDVLYLCERPFLFVTNSPLPATHSSLGGIDWGNFHLKLNRRSSWGLSIKGANSKRIRSFTPNVTEGSIERSMNLAIKPK